MCIHSDGHDGHCDKVRISLVWWHALERRRGKINERSVEKAIVQLSKIILWNLIEQRESCCTSMKSATNSAESWKSAAFRDSPQLVRFLTFVIEVTLAGQADRIKGYTIAIEALGRSSDFDPESDAIVRVEAWRLRKRFSITARTAEHECRASRSRRLPEVQYNRLTYSSSGPGA
jgi:hypothetical protein